MVLRAEAAGRAMLILDVNCAELMRGLRLGGRMRSVVVEGTPYGTMVTIRNSSSMTMLSLWIGRRTIMS